MNRIVLVENKIVNNVDRRKYLLKIVIEEEEAEEEKEIQQSPTFDMNRKFHFNI